MIGSENKVPADFDDFIFRFSFRRERKKIKKGLKIAWKSLGEDMPDYLKPGISKMNINSPFHHIEEQATRSS